MLPNFLTNPDPSLYLNGRYVVLDFETTNEENGNALNPDNQIVMSAWLNVDADGTVSRKKYKFGGEYEQAALLADIEAADFLVAHNAKFELQWLDRCGYDVGAKPVFDTMLAEYVLSGNRMWRLDLDTVAAKYGAPQKSKLIKRLMAGGVCPSDMPRSLLLKYGLGDVDATLIIFLAQLELLKGTRLLPIVYTRCLTTLALADIEKNGIFLDSAAVEEEYEKTLRKFIEIETELDEMSGGVNMNSPAQKIEYIYDTLGFEELRVLGGGPVRTAGGNPKTDKNTILALDAKTPEQKKFIELKTEHGKLNAALTKTLDFFVGVCRERDGMFYGVLRQGNTRTHRLSSSGRPIVFKDQKKAKSCQFQNLPNQYKPLVAARNAGWLVAEADGSQLEFRVGGHLGRDPQIRWDILHKEDIHSCTAKALTDAGEPTTRRAAKASTFRPMYGGTSGTPAVQAYCKFFAEKYHRLNGTQTEWAFEAAANKFIETEWGMRYYFPNVYVSKWGKVVGQQKVFNYPIQALATAEIIPIGLVFFWYRTRNMQLIITNTVHDSIICEVPPEEIELFELNAVKSLTEDVYEYLHQLYELDLTIPLGVGMKFGTHWSRSAYTDEQLEELVDPIRKLGLQPEVDDGEIAVDVPNPYVNQDEVNYG